MTSLGKLVHRIKDSVWAPVAAKGAAVVLILLTLGVVGSGALDKYLSAPAALAAAGKAKPSGAAKGGWGAAAPPSTGPAASGPASSAVTSPAPPGSASAAKAVAAITKDGKVILNLAGEAELVKIPGVGKKKAQAILALREKLGGRFKSVGDLTRVRGIKRKFLMKIRDHVVLDPDPEPTPEPAPTSDPKATPKP